MTRPESIALVEKWDRVAIARKDPTMRARLWRILYSLDGWYPAAKVVDDLDALAQTDEVEAIRELLGLETKDAPAWAGKV
jgi:hypothetical protein